jgi:hypothetical protein
MDYRALFAPDPGPDFNTLFAPDEISEEEANRTLTAEEQAKVAQPGRTWGEAFSEGLSNVPQDALATGKGLLESAQVLHPLGAARSIYETVTNPQGRWDQIKAIGEHYGNYLSEEGIKENIATRPVGTALDATMLLGGPKAVRGASKAPHEMPMPRGSVREQGELLSTGGKRMNEAKKSDVALPVEDILPSFSGFHARLGEKGIRINKKLHPKTYDAFQEFTNFVRPKGMETSPRPATMLDLHEVKQLAANAAKDVHPGTRKPTPDAMLATELINTIDEVIAKHPEGETFARGSNEYARGMKSQSIMQLLDDAKNTTQWDRGDHAGAIRNKINSFLKSRQARYLTKADIRELKKIKRFGFTEAIGGQGSFSPMAMLIGRTLEGTFGIPFGSLYIVGKMARDTINTNKPKRLENMAARIRAGE